MCANIPNWIIHNNSQHTYSVKSIKFVIFFLLIRRLQMFSQFFGSSHHASLHRMSFLGETANESASRLVWWPREFVHTTVSQLSLIRITVRPLLLNECPRIKLPSYNTNKNNFARRVTKCFIQLILLGPFFFLNSTSMLNFSHVTKYLKASMLNSH